MKNSNLTSPHLVESILCKLEEMKALDIVKLNHPFFEVAIICTGRSNVHIMSLCDKLSFFLKTEFNVSSTIEGYNSAEWVVILSDYIVINIFQKSKREEYDLEGLWKTIS